jgi:hypothetical protein
MTSQAIPGYSSRDWPGVNTFLAAHSGLCQALVELPTAVARYFAPGGQMTLEVWTDPDDGSQSLVATIVTALSPSRALARLDQFDRRWWHSRALRYSPLTVTVESTKSQGDSHERQ